MPNYINMERCEQCKDGTIHAFLTAKEGKVDVGVSVEARSIGNAAVTEDKEAKT